MTYFWCRASTMTKAQRQASLEKTHKCAEIARKMLPDHASDEVIEDQAADLMMLSDEALQTTYTRLKGLTHKDGEWYDISKTHRIRPDPFKQRRTDHVVEVLSWRVHVEGLILTVSQHRGCKKGVPGHHFCPKGWFMEGSMTSVFGFLDPTDKVHLYRTPLKATTDAEAKQEALNLVRRETRNFLTSLLKPKRGKINER